MARDRCIGNALFVLPNEPADNSAVVQDVRFIHVLKSFIPGQYDYPHKPVDNTENQAKIEISA